MITDRVIFLSELGLGLLCVGNNGLIVAVDVGWPINWDAHHTQLIPQSAQLFDAKLHGNKLSPKNG